MQRRDDGTRYRLPPSSNPANQYSIMNPETISANLLIPFDTSRKMDQLLDFLESETQYAPKYYGFNERKRLPYDRHAAATAQGNVDLLLWRQRGIQYFGSISRFPFSVNRLIFRTTNISSGGDMENIYAIVSRLVTIFGVEYGAIHERFVGFQEHDRAYLATYSLKAREFYENGVPGIGARTFFGSMLADRVGRERLAQLPNVTPLPDGGIQLDLVSEPWTADYETLLEAHRRVYPILAESGMFTAHPSNERASGWTRPDWIMKAGTGR